MKVLVNYSNYKASIIDLTMSSDVEFISTPTVELNLLKKSEQLQLAQRYKLMADNSAIKTQIKEVILKYLVDKEIIPSTETDTPSFRGITGELLQLKWLEFEEWEKEQDT